MGLDISVHYKDRETGEEKYAMYEPFGFETYRHKLWGAPIMIELGLTMLPSLGDGIWLQVSGDKLDQLAKEGYVIQNYKREILEQLPDIDEESLTNYLNRLFDAVQLAKNLDGEIRI